MEFNYLSSNKDIGVVKLIGEVDLVSLSEFSEFIEQVIQKPCQHLLFDLGELKYMNSTGFGLLASTAMEEKDKGEKEICFCNMHPTILNTYTLFGMQQVWPHYPTIEDAVSAIKKGQITGETADDIITFPIIRSCTHCHRPSNFAQPGNYKCPYCKTIHHLDEQGELKQLVPPKKKPRPQKTEELITDEIDISLPSDPMHLSRMRDFIFSFLTELFDEQQRANMAMAVDEAYANAIEHAHKSDRNKKVYMHIEVNIKKFSITIKDSGHNTFNNVIQRKEVNQGELKQTGRGMGLVLIKQMMDEVNFKPTETWGTAITMTKYVKD